MTPGIAEQSAFSEELFAECYRPIPNHLDKTAGFDFGAGGCLFAPATKQFRHVLAQSPRRIWTVLDDDDGRLIIESGLRLDNRLGYLIAERAREDDRRIRIPTARGR